MNGIKWLMSTSKVFSMGWRLFPIFISQKSGQVITATSSVAGLKSYPGGAVYGGTKWFVRDLMEVLRMESAREGNNIRTSTIYPAAISTELLNTITDENTTAGHDCLVGEIWDFGRPSGREILWPSLSISPKTQMLMNLRLVPTNQSSVKR